MERRVRQLKTICLRWREEWMLQDESKSAHIERIVKVEDFLEKIIPEVAKGTLALAGRLNTDVPDQSEDEVQDEYNGLWRPNGEW